MTDYTDIAEAQYIRELERAADFANTLDDVADELRKQIRNSLQGGYLLIDYTKTDRFSGKSHIWPQDATDALATLSDEDKVMDALHALMKTPQAESFIHVMTEAYIARHAEAIARVRMQGEGL